MEYALAEVGQSEIRGPNDNPRIQEYLACVSLPHAHDETPWCSAFANWCMKQAGIHGTGRGNARSWLTWSDKCLARPTYGAVTVLWREKPNGAKGHVAFYVGEQQGKIMLLGGNQRDKVQVAEYPASRVLGYRWPPGYAVPA